VTDNVSAPPTQVPRSDTDLWKVLINELKNKLTGNQPLGANAAVYVPPLNSQAIPAGDAVHEWITNLAIYHTAGNLLTPDSPLFQPGSGSYSKRLLI
jgi:hypothetical protein